MAALAAPPVVAAGVVVLFASVPNGTGTTEGDLWVGAGEFGPTSSAPAEDVQVAHDALHEIGAQCLTEEPEREVIAASVDAILAFASRYPTGRFPIDDETATATTLLVITRDAVSECAPWAVPLVEGELPADMRTAE